MVRERATGTIANSPFCIVAPPCSQKWAVDRNIEAFISGLPPLGRPATELGSLANETSLTQGVA